MRVLVVAPAELHQSTEGASICLRDLGCDVVPLDLWEAIGDELPAADAILIEAGDHAEVGRAVVRAIRESPSAGLPVLLAVSVNGLSRLNERDPIDDVVLRPYVPQELVLRLRRAEWQRSEFERDESIKIGRLHIDLLAHEVRVGDERVALTAQEFSLLRFLASHRGRVFSRSQLLKEAWGVEHYGESRTVDIHVRRLRKKLGEAVKVLETVRGVGYKMVAFGEEG